MPAWHAFHNGPISVVTTVGGKGAKAFAGAMEAVQEALGEHQDAVCTHERLRELAMHANSDAAAFL